MLTKELFRGIGHHFCQLQEMVDVGEMLEGRGRGGYFKIRVVVVVPVGEEEKRSHLLRRQEGEVG
jgi:hypothetical protein